MAYEIREAKEQVIRAGLELLKSGLIARTWGNISARISDTQFVITPSGMAYDRLGPEDLVTVNIADCSYEGSIKPSSEKGIHAAAYAHRPEVNFVIHTHQNFASAVSTLHVDLASGTIDPDTIPVLGKRVPAAEYGLSSTKKLTKAVEHAIVSNPESRAVLLVNHGTLCMGRDYEDAFNIAHVLEAVSEKRYRALCEGLIPTDVKPGYGIGSGEGGEDAENDFSRYEKIYSGLPQGERGFAILSTAPFTMEVSRLGKTMKAYIDDMAQICGADVKCVSGGEKAVEKALKGRRAVLLQGAGAICISEEEDDARAVAMVLEKNAMAAILKAAGDSPKPVNFLSANLEHLIYEKKYSKLKNR